MGNGVGACTRLAVSMRLPSLCCRSVIDAGAREQTCADWECACAGASWECPLARGFGAELWAGEKGRGRARDFLFCSVSRPAHSSPGRCAGRGRGVQSRHAGIVVSRSLCPTALHLCVLLLVLCVTPRTQSFPALTACNCPLTGRWLLGRDL